MKNSDLIRSKRQLFDDLPNPSILPRKKHRGVIVNTASIHIQTLGLPLVPTTTGSSSESISLEPHRPYTIGRSRRRCDFLFEDRRVSKKHCQILFDAVNRKIFIADGVFWCVSGDFSRIRVSLNGLFVNGIRMARGEYAVLGAGDEVSLVCGNEVVCSLGCRIGFVVQRIVFVEEVLNRGVSTFGAKWAPSGYVSAGSPYDGVTARVNLLRSQCRRILCSNDPLSRLRKSNVYHRMNNALGLIPSDIVNSPGGGLAELGGTTPVELPPGGGSHADQELENVNANIVELSSYIFQRGKTVVSKVNPASEFYQCNGLQQTEHVEASLLNSVLNDEPKTLYMVKEHTPQIHLGSHYNNRSISIPPPGNKFYLNRLQSMGHGLLDPHAAVSLPELLHPVDTIQQMFIASFTSDIVWFLSYCEIPASLPVTIACHNRERCWSSSPDKRTSVPFSDFPNLVVVYPSFPEIIAFGKDRKNLGIACHHPKLLVLQREDSMRVVITSANLVAKQWNSVTNTIWWQDFPRTSRPEFLSLFTQLSDGDTCKDLKSDFAAQLAGFMATLIADVPSQAHWILELTKYDFKGAGGYLVASVPGIHSQRAPPVMKSMRFLPVLGSVETSVVGLSHLFHTSADRSGAQLKKLASFLGKCGENANGMLEIILRRITNIPADANAVSVLVPNPKESSDRDCVQLGFLPRHVAKWVAPLSDTGLFRFSGYVYPKEVLNTALEGSTSKVQLVLYVSEGPAFSEISDVERFEHAAAICLLIASVQRCTGLWRLQEVLSRYKWPEHLETDFIFSSSSIGSVNAQFLAAFSAAAGKISVRYPESEESDPDWGCWSASQELRNPSIRIIYPTIKRVKSAGCGISASKYILCFSQKTWQRLRNVDILHDAIPYPSDRVNHPMHVKVGRRRFQSKDGLSFGWVYCGSHNLSAAAWGRPISNSSGTKAVGVVKTNTVLGSRLHICNYELGIIFIVPPSDTKGSPEDRSTSLDDITLPFVVPAPKYRPSDRPATAQAMREALAELVDSERDIFREAADAGEDEIPDEEEEVIEATPTDYVTEEQEDEKAYAEILWSQVDSSQSC